jgi:hypothetical protein
MSLAASSWRTKASQKWGERARWLSGEGPFAVIAPCREFSFSLWATKEAAEKAKVHLDQMGCGGGCNPLLHKVVDLSE